MKRHSNSNTRNGDRSEASGDIFHSTIYEGVAGAAAQ
jgi:hypothetical protein